MDGVYKKATERVSASASTAGGSSSASTSGRAAGAEAQGKAPALPSRHALHTAQLLLACTEEALMALLIVLGVRHTPRWWHDACLGSAALDALHLHIAHASTVYTAFASLQHCSMHTRELSSMPPCALP